MANPKFHFLLVVGAFTGSTYAACSPSGGDEPAFGSQGAGSTGGQSSGGANAGAATAGSNGASSGFANSGFGNGGLMFSSDGGVSSNVTDASCRAVTQEPEQIVVYHDATVTDTITTYSPVALFIMQDRSGSMVTGFPPPASPDSWNNSAAAISAFVNDPLSAGIEVGLGTFPYGPNNTAACDGSDCGTPVVPIAPLPQNASAMVSAMQAQAPSSPVALTPTECALRGMINQCAQFMQQSTTGEQCVAILITDGTPTQCDGDHANLTQIVADGYNDDGVITFTLGLPGADLAFLDQLAAAGGTTASIDVTQGTQVFIDALNSIRDSVSTTTSMQVTTQEVISTPLDCQWGVPAPPEGQVFNPEKVNLQFTPSGGAPQNFGYVASEADCGGATDAWYFDDPTSPTQVFVCPQTCEVVKNSAGASVNIQLGCDRIEKVPQ